MNAEENTKKTESGTDTKKTKKTTKLDRATTSFLTRTIKLAQVIKASRATMASNQDEVLKLGDTPMRNAIKKNGGIVGGVKILRLALAIAYRLAGCDTKNPVTILHVSARKLDVEYREARQNEEYPDWWDDEDTTKRDMWSVMKRAMNYRSKLVRFYKSGGLGVPTTLDLDIGNTARGSGGGLGRFVSEEMRDTNANHKKIAALVTQLDPAYQLLIQSTLKACMDRHATSVLTLLKMIEDREDIGQQVFNQGVYNVACENKVPEDEIESFRKLVKVSG